MQVSIIIINYNTFQLTRACISSVIAHTRACSYEIILVDNASTDKDPGEFVEEFPGIVLVRNPRNSGFADGNNLGVQHARGKYILLLNSDTLLLEDSISASVSKMEEDDRIGVLGCRMTWPDGQVQHTARRFRSIGWELLDLFRFIPRMMSYRSRWKLMLGRYFRHDEDTDCDWVNGAFFLFRASILPQLPGQKLDDRFFMYGEDHLWCEQIRRLGYRVYFFAGTSIIHINSGSTDPARRLALRKTMYRNELEIIRERKGSGLYFFFFRFLYGTKEAVRNFLKGIIFKTTGKQLR